MKSRSLLILAVAFIALVLVAKFAGQSSKREAPGGLKPGSRLFALDDFNQVARISIADATQTVVLVKNAAGKWTVESLHNHPADFDRVADDILNKLGQLRVGEARKASEKSLKDYGLDATATGEGSVTPVSVSLKDAAGKDLGALKIGKERSRPAAGGQGGFPDSQFVQLDKGPVVLVTETLGRPSAAGKDWISTKLLAVTAEQLERVSVNDKDGKSYELTRGLDGKFSAKEKADAESVLDEGARTLFGAIAYLNATDVAGPADQTADAFAGTNWSFTAKSTDGATYSVTVGKAAGALRHARFAIAYDKPAMPTGTDTNAVEAAKKSFEEKIAKDSAAATALNAQLAPWTYLIEESAAMTLALPREQVIGIPPPPSTNAAPAATGLPEGLSPGGFPGLPAGFPAGVQ